jgi:hypothetical protein
MLTNFSLIISVADVRSIACCVSGDLCNKELAPVYSPSREEEGGEGGLDPLLDPSVYHLALLVSLTVCLVLFILLLTFAYLRYGTVFRISA